jgi:hypothetical protein
MPITQADLNTILCIIEKRNIKFSNGWKNFSKNLHCPNAMVLNIEDTASLQEIVSVVDELNQTKNSEDRIILRAASGGGNDNSQSYSFTSGAEADIIVRLVGKEFRQIEHTTQKNIMRVGASVQIGELDKELYEKHNLSLATSSLIPYVTVAGLAANAGHGTGVTQPSFCGQIKSMTLCLPNGKIVKLDASHKDFETIRGANLGLFGIVLDVEIECVEAMKMHCTMEVCTTPDFIDKVKSGVFTKYAYVSAMIVPTYRKNELTNNKDKNVIIYGWNPVPKSTPDKNSCPQFAHLSQAIQIKLEAALRITDLLRKYPHLIPYYMRYLVTSVIIGNNNSESVAPWHSVHYQTIFPTDIDDADYLFEVSSDFNEMVVAFEKIISTLSEFAKNEQYPITDGIYLRLFKGTSGGLSTSTLKNKNYICGLDVVSSNGILGYDEFKKQMKEYFINGELVAKPHWGKYVPLDVDYKKMYGNDYDQFINALNEWYSSYGMRVDKSMLLNNFLCDILQIPYPLKQYDKNLNPILYTLPKCNFKKIANTLTFYIEHDNPQSTDLLRCLHCINNENLLISNDCMFASGLHEKRREKNDEKQIQDTTCCVL